jgi:hypothetical protein
MGYPAYVDLERSESGKERYLGIESEIRFLVAYRSDHAFSGRHNNDPALTSRITCTPALAKNFIRLYLVILNMDFNYNSRMSQSYRGSQQQQQGRTKKKEEDPDAFMRLVRPFQHLRRNLLTTTCSPTRTLQDVSATSAFPSACPIFRSRILNTYKWSLSTWANC